MDDYREEVRAPGDRFDRAADRITSVLGSWPALAGSVVIVMAWALTGPIFGFSDTWQLFINTTTTVVTFWMVFVIQNSANRTAKATALKLDELIRAVDNARNEFIDLDRASAADLAMREREMVEVAHAGAPEEPLVADVVSSGNGVRGTPTDRN